MIAVPLPPASPPVLERAAQFSSASSASSGRGWALNFYYHYFHYMKLLMSLLELATGDLKLAASKAANTEDGGGDERIIIKSIQLSNFSCRRRQWQTQGHSITRRKRSSGFKLTNFIVINLAYIMN